MEKTDAGFTVTESHLDMTAKIPGIDAEKFFTIANGAKAGCPISRLLNAKVSLNAKFGGVSFLNETRPISSPDFQKQLSQLREALLGLHKALVDSERVSYEQNIGTIPSANHFLNC